MKLTVTNDVLAILMRRDQISETEAREMIKECENEMNDALERGDDPAEIIMRSLGLEPDYINI